MKSAAAKEDQEGDLLATQRKFIHDLATPTAVAHAMIEMVIATLREKSVGNEAELVRLQKALAATTKITAILEENRNYLIGVA